jgi:5-methylcytosine-specific restriction endonuclease McrA
LGISYLDDLQFDNERMRFLVTMPYRDYLKTPEWHERRKEHLVKAFCRCQVCNASQIRLEVHHRTYERRGYERYEDLIVLCDKCHKLFHEQGKLL